MLALVPGVGAFLGPTGCSSAPPSTSEAGLPPPVDASPNTSPLVNNAPSSANHTHPVGEPTPSTMIDDGSYPGAERDLEEHRVPCAGDRPTRGSAQPDDFSIDLSAENLNRLNSADTLFALSTILRRVSGTSWSRHRRGGLPAVQNERVRFVDSGVWNDRRHSQPIAFATSASTSRMLRRQRAATCCLPFHRSERVRAE